MSEQRLLSQSVHDLAAKIFARRVGELNNAESVETIQEEATAAISDAEIFEIAWLLERADSVSLLTEHGFSVMLKNKKEAE